MKRNLNCKIHSEKARRFLFDQIHFRSKLKLNDCFEGKTYGEYDAGPGI